MLDNFEFKEERVDPVEQTQNINFVISFFEEHHIALYMIALCGVVVVLLTLERLASLYRLGVDKEDFNNKLFSMLSRGDLRQSIAFCDSINVPLANTLKKGLQQVLNQRPDDEVQVAMDSQILNETPKIEGWTQMLAVLGNVATLIGLLGTIVGMIVAFSGVSEADSALRAQMLSKGISQALYATASGIGVAIPALLMFGFFQVRIGRILNEVQESSMELINIVVANRDKMKG